MDLGWVPVVFAMGPERWETLIFHFLWYCFNILPRAFIGSIIKTKQNTIGIHFQSKSLKVFPEVQWQ